MVDLKPGKVARFVLRLQDRFYVDADMIHGAIRREGSTNLVHLETGFKIDLFLRQFHPFDHSEFRRHQLHRLSEDSPQEVMVKSAEDTLLRKVQWYKTGRMVSDRQWNDILRAVLTVLVVAALALPWTGCSFYPPCGSVTVGDTLLDIYIGVVKEPLRDGPVQGGTESLRLLVGNDGDAVMVRLHHHNYWNPGGSRCRRLAVRKATGSDTSVRLPPGSRPETMAGVPQTIWRYFDG